MDNIYKTPDAQLTDSSDYQPSRLLVDIFFWVGHLCFVIFFGAFVIDPDIKINWFIAGSMAAGSILLFLYMLALAIYASRMGRSGIVWGGLTFVFSPISLWISYPLSFTLKQSQSSKTKK